MLIEIEKNTETKRHVAEVTPDVGPARGWRVDIGWFC